MPPERPLGPLLAMPPPEDGLHQLALVVTELSTKFTGLTESVQSMKTNSERDSKQLFELLTYRLNAMDKISDRHESELSGLGARFDIGLNELDAELTLCVTEHSHESAPHDASIGRRLGVLENALSYQKGAIRVLAVFSPIVAALLTAGLMKVTGL